MNCLQASSFSNVFPYALIILIASSFGFNYGESNHTTYLVAGLLKANPDFLAYDWFAQETIHYHAIFAYVVSLVAKYVDIGLGLALINLFVISATYFAVYKMLVCFDGHNARLALIFLLVFVVVDQTRSVGYSYIQSAILQPSSIASVFFVFAILFFLKGKIVYSGIALGLSGLFHTNYLLLDFPVFGIAHVLLGRENMFVRMLHQHGLAIVFMLYQIPFLLSLGQGEGADVAREIFLTVRSPHHYVPSYYLYDFVLLLGWGCVGWVSLANLQSCSVLLRRTRMLYIAFAAVLIVAALLIIVIDLKVVAQLFPWRMAPYFVLMAQCCFVIFALQSRGKTLKRPRIALVGLILGLLLIFRWHIYFHEFHSLKLILILTSLLALLTCLVWPLSHIHSNMQSSYYRYVSSGVLFWFLCSALVLSGKQVCESSLFASGMTPDKVFFAWARTTPLSSQFLIPPDMDQFRIKGERAIVADWKSTPVDPAGLQEWYRRMQDVSGVEGLENYQNAKDGYRNMTLSRLLYLRDKYQLNYYVQPLVRLNNDHGVKKRSETFEFPVVFENVFYRVYEL